MNVWLPTAQQVMLLTLRRSGVSLRYTQEELVALGLDAAQGALDVPEVIDWLEAHWAK